MAVQIRRGPPTGDAAVFIRGSRVGGGLHTGIVYRDSEERWVAGDMRWEGDLSFSEYRGDVACVTPSSDDDALADLATLMDTIRARVHNLDVPFGFARANARITRKGGIDLGSAQGLNCSTFVLLVYQRAGIPLLDEESWSQRAVRRRREDEGVQEALVRALRSDYPERARQLESEVGCTRFRPEEVAGASGSDGCPLSFEAGSNVGSIVLREVGIRR